jgi:type IV pilus assembly protein PilC
LEKSFQYVVRYVRQGITVDKALEELKLFSERFLKMVQIGHETGYLSEMLAQSADILDEDLERKAERFVRFAEPVSAAVLTVVLGAVLVSVALPLIGIIDSIML